MNDFYCKERKGSKRSVCDRDLNINITLKVGSLVWFNILSPCTGFWPISHGFTWKNLYLSLFANNLIASNNDILQRMSARHVWPAAVAANRDGNFWDEVKVKSSVMVRCPTHWLVDDSGPANQKPGQCFDTTLDQLTTTQKFPLQDHDNRLGRRGRSFRPPE